MRSGDRAPFSLFDADMEIFDFASVLGKLECGALFHPATTPRMYPAGDRFQRSLGKTSIVSIASSLE